MKADSDRRLNMKNAFPNRGGNINDHVKIIAKPKVSL